MKTFFLFVGVLLLCSSGNIEQKFKTSTASARQYIAVAEKIQQGLAVDPEDWSRLFTTPPYDMMIQGGAIDTSKMKSIMEKVYSSNRNIEDTTDSYRYHYEYKRHLPAIKKYLDLVEQDEFKERVFHTVKSFLPNRLNGEIPKLQFFYTVYGTEESTGMYGMVINDALLTYKADAFQPGLISAHEIIHAMVSVSFQNKLKPDVDYNSTNFALLYFIQTILEEGVADLIDKEALADERSPLREKVIALTKDDEHLSKIYLSRLDSLLSAAADNEKSAFSKLYNSTELNNFLGQNGGHIPGRYMVNVIKNAGLLPELIDNIDNPLILLSSYQKAVEGKSDYIQISDYSIEWFAKLQSSKMNH